MTLNEHVLSLQDQMIACLQENLRIPSVQGEKTENAPYGTEVKACLDHVMVAAENLGFKPTNVDNHVLWCEYGQGEEMVAVLGHLDVVPAGDGWTCDPYGGEIRDGKIWGRGTTDDKGPSIAALYALAALRDSGLPIKRRVRLILGCNEETGSADIKYYRAHGGEDPVMGFTPDGEYPVINGEKGIINANFSVSFSQSGEVKILEINGGTAPNVVPASAFCKLGCSQEIAQAIAKSRIDKVNFTVTDYGVLVEAEGVSAHGSTPELGENAIGRLLLALDQLPLSPESFSPVHFLANFLGMETDGKSAGIALYDEVSGGLTLNLGTLSGDDKGFALKINYRYPVTKEYADCGPAFNKAFQDAGFTLDSELHKAKLYIPEDSQLVSTLLKVYKEHTGHDGKPKSIGGGTYAKMLPNILAFGPIFPGDEIREHKPDEYITIENLVKNAQIIAAAMYEMAK